MDFHLSLSDCKSSQVSRTLLRILSIFNNYVVWMVSTRPPTSKSSRPFNNPLVNMPKAPITIGTIVTVIFYSFFQFSSEILWDVFFKVKILEYTHTLCQWGGNFRHSYISNRIPITSVSLFFFYQFNAFNNALSFFSHSFSFILWSAETAKATILKILFFVDYYKVWFSDRD